MGKIEIHKAFRTLFGILAPEILRVPIGSAGGSIQSKAYGIKYGSFAGAGIPRNKEQALFIKLRKIDFRHR
jgi:hypothetical protein